MPPAGRVEPEVAAPQHHAEQRAGRAGAAAVGELARREPEVGRQERVEQTRPAAEARTAAGAAVGSTVVAATQPVAGARHVAQLAQAHAPAHRVLQDVSAQKKQFKLAAGDKHGAGRHARERRAGKAARKAAEAREHAARTGAAEPRRERVELKLDATPQARHAAVGTQRRARAEALEHGARRGERRAARHVKVDVAALAPMGGAVVAAHTLAFQQDRGHGELRVELREHGGGQTVLALDGVHRGHPTREERRRGKQRRGEQQQAPVGQTAHPLAAGKQVDGLPHRRGAGEQAFRERGGRAPQAGAQERQQDGDRGRDGHGHGGGGKGGHSTRPQESHSRSCRSTSRSTTDGDAPYSRDRREQSAGAVHTPEQRSSHMNAALAFSV